MYIDNYDYYFYEHTKERGQDYYDNKKILSFQKIGDNKYEAKVQGSTSKPYTVGINIDSEGFIGSLSCSCPYGKRRLYCKHIYAVLLHVDNIYYSDIYTGSSPVVSDIISAYTNRASGSRSFDNAKIVPELVLKDDSLFMKLKIGCDKLYAVSNIYSLISAFDENEIKTYGKNFQFCHTYDSIDEKSKKLLQLSGNICISQISNIYNRKMLRLYGNHLESFLDLYNDEPLVINKNTYQIKHRNPKINFSLKYNINQKIILTKDDSISYLGHSMNGYFISENKQTLYVTDLDFALSVNTLLNTLNENDSIVIGKKDIPSFYNAVIKPLEKYVTFHMNNVPETILPPQMNASLFVDVNSDDEITANLKFNYDDKIYPAFYNSFDNPLRDVPGENFIYSEILMYFTKNENTADSEAPFVIFDEDKIFEFVSSGITRLNKSMVVFVSDKLKNFNVRPTVQPKVGVRTEGNLLELDISAFGYSKKELLEMLQSYRLGKKYHRFKDGSFSFINDSMSELSEITTELNINDKAFLKDNISVPMYRMIYLNSLAKDLESTRISRSREFKKLAEGFNNSINFSDEQSVPKSLDAVMRDYQKIGFDWLKTLYTYRLGGILADDMGLGKTVQAIALMLCIKESSQKHEQFLVICPSSLTINWENEIKKFAPALKTVCLNGSVAERKKLFEEIDNYDVLITSYATVLRDIDKYETMNFTVQFVDEAQNIKNHTTQSAKAVKAIKSSVRFALTGTPVENTLAELWSIFDFIMPGYLFGYSYFKKNFETPIVKKNDSKAVNSLRRLTSPFILRRLKKDVLTELPDKTETVLIAEMEGEQKKVYAANAAQIRGELMGMESSDKIKILAMLTRLRQLCCDPSLVYENFEGSSAKLEQCIELVKNCVESGHKILLFSQFTTMLDKIEKRLNDESISSFMLTGQTKTKERIRLVNEFNENDTNVFLISLKAGGTGLNLTGADIVIHYDPWWNLSAENQASDRAYRIGQKNNVQIYKLIVKNTIEERIRELQQKKSDLLDTAVSGDGDIMNMTSEDIISLLE